MKIIFTFFLIFFTHFLSFSQTKGIILDKETSEPIPYANISIKNHNFGTTSNENGEFIINENTDNEQLVISSIGYENAIIKLNGDNNRVYLKPKSYIIREVYVKPRKERLRRIVNSLKNKRSKHSFACNEYAWIAAKHFKYNSEYSETPFISKIIIQTSSRVNNAKFNVRLLSSNEKGEPSEEIYSENLIAYAKRGKRAVKIDLSDKNIVFPENGLFVALEWLIIEENVFKYVYTMNGSKKKYDGISYEPKFSVFRKQGESETWVYIGGKWFRKGMTQNPNEYLDLAIELTLSN